ncbi:MAG TPA: PQQ-dependent sugar dehydrogenase [Candidatus Acidoferrales bacterium]|nr:PQQ-dependent sugar dehydrogenase [Candidatus Acidoferrales bacterium]
MHRMFARRLQIAVSLLLLSGGLPSAALAVGESCESLSARYLSAVVLAARTCMVRNLPRGRQCTTNNRIPNLRANKVSAACAAGTTDRLDCTARQGIIASGLPYDTSLPGSGFTHICTSASCGNGVLEAGEQCDDGNVINGDGCSATCQLEGGACNDICAGVVPVSGTSIVAERVATGLTNPLLVTAPPRDVSRLFIVQQTGQIKILKWGAMLPTPFLDVSSEVSCCGEQGLLGLAFHPDFVNNGRFFIDYTDTMGNTVVAERRVSSNPDVSDVTETALLHVTQPFANHNGGHLAFGPDGYLYIGLGDGGSGGDPFGNGQNINQLLGKLLRIDVDSASPYGIPPTNPFAGATPGADEIWAYGLRNPWRYSFDRLNGDLYIGDVGQDRFEEVDYQPALSSGGQNYGWNVVEGNGHCYPSGSGCDQTGMTLPVLDYDHSNGCSITGGYVYRGCKMPDLRGTYFYGDYCSHFVRTLQISGGAATNLQDRTADIVSGGASIGSISSFGEDARGEMYIVDLGGSVFKIVPGP